MNIGIFDSGVGGLRILKEFHDNYPKNNYFYVADQYNVPYGPKSVKEVKYYSQEITNFLINKGCEIIVLACNTATASSIKYLRKKFPKIFFIGIEPALKPAIRISKSRKIGVLATANTLAGNFYNSFVGEVGNQNKIFKNSCDGLVEEIEKGYFESNKISEILDKTLNPMISDGIDTVVLGCTHYPYIFDQIKSVVGSKVKIIDPAPAIVKRLGYVLKERKINKNNNMVDKVKIFTTSDKDKINKFLPKVINFPVEISEIHWGQELKQI